MSNRSVGLIALLIAYARAEAAPKGWIDHPDKRSTQSVASSDEQHAELAAMASGPSAFWVVATSRDLAADQASLWNSHVDL